MIKITEEIRRLLCNKIAQDVLLDIFSKRDDKNIVISLPLAGNVIEHYIETAQRAFSLGEPSPDDSSLLDDAYKQDDISLLVELERQGILSFNGFDSNDYITGVVLKDQKKLSILIDWFQEVWPHLIHHGVISLDTSSGRVYFFDRQVKLDPNKTEYKVLKHLIKDKEHRIGYPTIYFYRNNEDWSKDDQTSLASVANQVIKDIKKKLKEEPRVKQLFRVADEQAYILFPDVPKFP